MNPKDVHDILKNLGFDDRFNTEQTAICVISLFQNHPKLLRIHDIIVHARKELGKEYAENTRESIRKSSLKRLVNHGLVINNKDDPTRPTNSGNNNYCLTESFYEILSSKNPKRKQLISEWNKKQAIIVKQLEDPKHDVRVRLPNGKTLTLSPGPHNILEKHIVEDLLPLVGKNMDVLYLGDTRKKMLYVNEKLLSALGITLDEHDKLPDVIAWSNKSKKVCVIESVTSVGPVEESRKKEIHQIINEKSAKSYDIVYITAFLDRKTFRRFSEIIAKNTYVWIAMDPKGLVHYSDSGIDL